MNEKIKSLFISFHTWQIVLFTIMGAILITNLVTALVSLWMWGKIQTEILLLGTINAVLVPLILLPLVVRSLRKTLQLEEQNKAHVETISRLKNQGQMKLETQRRADEMSLLYQLGILFAAGKNLYETLLILESEIMKLAQADILFVAIYDEQTDIVDYPIFFRRGIPQPRDSRKLSERPGLTGGVIYSKKTLYLPDMMAVSVIAQYAPVGDAELTLRTFLGIPLVVNERVMGVLSVQSIEADAYSKDQIQLIENVAVQAATAIDKASLLDQLKQELKERQNAETQLREREVILEAVTFSAEQFLKMPDWHANVNLVLERLGKTLAVTHAYLFEDHLDARGELVTSMRYEWTALGYPSDLQGPYFQNSKVHQEGYEEQVEALGRGDVRVGTASTFNPIEKEAMDQFGVKAILEVPVFVNEKEWGAIGFDDFEREREWSNAEVEALKIAAGVLSAAIQRQEAETAVRESERIYRRAIEAADAVPYYLDYKSNSYLFMGQGILEMTGYRPEEMSPPVWSDIVLETVMLDEAEGLSAAEAIDLVRHGSIKAWKCDQKIRTRDGKIRWLTDRSVELLDEQGVSNGSIGILQDITNRKLVEANLRQREAMLEAITFAAEQFLKVSDWRTNINNVLERLGKTMDVTHAYLFEHHFWEDGTEVATLAFEWTAPGFPNYLNNPIYPNTHVLWEGAGDKGDHLTKGEVFLGNSSNFPDVEKERFAQLGIKAIAEVPLFVNGAWWGTIGFDEMLMERNWSPPEADALKIAAGILSAAIQRQEAEAAVHESERIYRQAIESAGAVPYYRDYRENRYTFMGAQIERIIGYRPEEVTVDLWRKIMKENIPLGGGQGLSVDEAVQQARTGGLKVWRSDMRVLAKNGEERWITDSAVELFDDSPMSYASVGILQDITERKKTEVNLRKRESILEAISFAAEQFLRASNWRQQIDVVLERLGKEFNASHAYLFERHRGSNNEILSSMTYEWTAPECVSDLGDPEFQNLPLRSMGFERLFEILDRGDPLIGSASFFKEQEREYLNSINVKALLEMRVIVDGQQWGTIGFDDVLNEREWTPMEVDVLRVACNVLGAAIKRQNDEAALQNELDERQRLIGELERRNAESETLRQSTAIVAETLERSEAVDRILEQLARVVAYDSASVQLLIGDVLEIVSFRGPGLNRNDTGMRFPVNEMEPAYPVIQGWVPYVLYDDVQVSLSQFDDYPHNTIHGWLAVPLKVKGQIRGIIALDGHRPRQFNERDAELALTYANQVSIALENARLFSDLQIQFDERQKLIGELENKNSELERFTYTVSHDLKSPLVTITGFLGYLEQDAASGNAERMRGDIQRIHEAVKKMQNLLKELLELSRIGRVVNPPTKVPFNDLVREAMLLVGGRLAARQVNVFVQPNLPTVNVDKPRIVEVLQNLLDNAAKYMGDQAEPQIEIGERGEQAGHPVFYVRDNGIGIDPQFHERVFGLFNKLDPNSDGTGVGLALVKRIIEIHGGWIWVESEAGQGSTFCFTLPTQPKPNSVI